MGKGGAVPEMEAAWHNILSHKLNAARITNLNVGLKKAWFSFCHDNFKLSIQSNEVITVSLNICTERPGAPFFTANHI